MSTKTSIKRIALVAVSALGFGLLSIAPSAAAGVAGTAAAVGTATQTVQAGTAVTSTFSLTHGALATATTDTTAALITLTKPGASTVTLADKNGDGTANDPALTNAGNNAGYLDGSSSLGAGAASATWTSTVAGADLAAGTYVNGTIGFTPDVPGTYTVTVQATAANGTTAAGTAVSATVIVLPSTSSTATLTATNSKPVYTAENVDAVITVSRNTGGLKTDGQILGRVDATANATSSGAIGSIFGTTATKSSGMTAALSGTHSTSFTMDIDVIANVAAGVYATAGSYTFTFWNDSNSNGALDSGEPTTTSTVVIGAVSASTSLISATLSRTLASTSTGTSSFTVTATVTDADGNPITGTVYAAETGSTGAAYVSAAANNSGNGWTDVSNAIGASGSPLTRVGLTNTYVGTFSVDTAYTAADYVDTYITVYTDNVLATATTSAKKALRIANIADLTAVAGVPTIQLTDAVGIGTVTSGVKQTLTGDANANISVTVDRTVTTHTYTFNAAAGNEGEYLRVNVAPATLTSSTVVAPAVALVAVGADLTAKYTVTATAPAAADGYTLTVTGGTDDSATVTFATAAPSWSVSPSASFKAKFGDTSTITGTLSDQFGRILSAKAVYVSVTGRNAGTYNGTTAADGTFAFTWKDASAATTVTLTDALTFNYPYFASAASTSTILATSASRTVTYSATGVAVGSISVAAPSATTTRPIDMNASVGLPGAGSRVTYTAQVKDAAGLPVTSGALVTFTGGADDLFYGGTTGVTDEFGQASVTVYRTKVGAPAIKATAGGVTSAASAAVQWTNDVANRTAASAPIASSAKRQARYITLAADVASVVSAGIIRFTAKVTDRWGNAVEGAQVTFAETGAGRFYNPPTSNQVNTNAAGEASIDLNSQAGETGAVSVTATITEATALQAINEDANGFMTVISNITNDTTFSSTLTAVSGVTAAVKSATATATITKDTSVSTADALLEVAKAQAAAAEAAKSADAANAAALLELAKAIGTGKSVEEAADAAAEAIDAANAATDAANLAAEAADAATVAAEEARDAADSATAAVEELATQVATLMAALKAQLTTLANTVAKIAKKVKA